MTQSTDSELWHQFVRPNCRISFLYPTITPLGRQVERSEDVRDDTMRVHISARNSQEVYVELLQIRDIEPRAVYARHSAYLEQRFGAGSTTDLADSSLGRMPAWAYDFRWDHSERSVLLLRAGRDTYRIIYDPRSALNMRVVASITIIDWNVE